MSKTYSDNLRSDIPGELRDKIKLWEVLNKILKNNGYIDIDAINESLANLKQQINILLTDVLGIEHEIDNVHNYDDTDLKSKLTLLSSQLDTSIGTINGDISDIQGDVNSLSNRLNGINSTSSQVAITNPSVVRLEASFTEGSGSEIKLIPAQINLITNDGSAVLGQVAIGPDGVDINSDGDVHIAHRQLQHYVTVTSTQNQISDVNGLKFSYDAQGVIITNFVGDKACRVNWST
jgi:hypothetical protein